MNTIDKKQLEDSLETIAQFYCAYQAYSGQMCDCKFLMPNSKMQHMSEQCGCPEIKLAKALIKAMTKKDYANLVKKLTRRPKK